MRRRTANRTPGLRPGVLLLALALLTSLSPAVAAAVPQGHVGIRLVDVPTDRADDPRARLYIIDHVQQGASIERRVEIESGLPDPTDVKLYAAGATVEDGEFVFFEGAEANELSEWTSASPATMRLGAHGAAVATIEVDVPENADSGERYAVVWAELPPAVADAGVSEITRVGIRIYLSVGKGQEPPSDFVIESLTASRTEADTPQVDAVVRNTGKRALDMTGSLTLTEGPGGLSAGPFDAEVGTTLGIGESVPVSIALSPELPAGPWLAKLTMRSGALKRSAEATIAFPDETGATGPAVTPEAETSLPMITGLMAPALMALSLFLFLWKRRRDEETAESS